MNRKLRVNVPSSIEARKPHVPDRKLLVEREKELSRKQKYSLIDVTGLGSVASDSWRFDMNTRQERTRNRQR